MSRRAAIDLATQCRLAGLPEPEREVRFDRVRRWRFDYAWPAHRFAVELDGGGFVQGRHSRGLGIEKDAEKLAHAALAGWTVIRVTPRQVADGRAMDWIGRLLSRQDSDRA